MKLKNLITVLIITFSTVYSPLYSQITRKGEDKITPEVIKEYIDFLASDSLKGRNTPSKELDIAADYIAEKFEQYNLKKINGSYFQTIPLFTKNLDKKSCAFKIYGNGYCRNFDLKYDYIPFEMTASDSCDAEIIFAGYGISAPEFKYDDYSGIDVKGKIVLVLKNEPGEKDSTSVFDGCKITKYSFINTKVENAKRRGAVGLMIVNGPLNHMILSPQGYPWPSLSKFLPQDNLPIELDRGNNINNIPVVEIGDKIVTMLFGGMDSLRQIQRVIDSTFLPNSFLVKGKGCKMNIALNITELSAKNVVGYVEGSDNILKEEVVVIGGHYDHVGFLKNHKEGEDYIFNGADDNASGSAGVMSIADAFSAMKRKPKRSVLFILFAGEEKGLYGSLHYCNNPLFPLEKSVAMLNLDMIGRNGDNTIGIVGDNKNPDLFDVIKIGNKNGEFEYLPSLNNLFTGSDHYNFFLKGISAVDITGGLHNDYHTVFDNPDKINNKKAAKIARLIFRSAWIIANEDKHYKVIID